MNSINDFPWNKEGIISRQYEEPNYKIVKTRASGSKRALIFFSSNGIYFPNNEKEFREKILELDYYDWLNIGRHRLIQRHFSKIIFVRDIYKQWYVTGINSRIDSQYKLFEFLRDELEGYSITTCGSSSGGYMAALMGSLLDAERIIDSSGQFDLSVTMGNEPFLDMMADDPGFSRYISIKDVIGPHLGSLYYFYPARSEKDIVQNRHVEELDIKRFAMDSDKHNRTIKPVCYPYVLTMPSGRLDALCKKYSGSIIGETELYKDMVPGINRITDPALYNAGRICSYILNYSRGVLRRNG